MSLVDVIIPVYNTPIPFVRATLDSLAQQTVTDWTAWIINDASAPEYTKLLIDTLDSYKDARLQYLYSEHKGPAGSRNVGIVKGTAPYVAFLDSDDIWMPQLLKQHLSILEENQEVVLVHGHHELINTDGQTLQPVSPYENLNTLGRSETMKLMLSDNFISTSSVVIRRKAIESVGLFDESFPCLVDKQLWLRILSTGALFRYNPHIVFQYRLHPNNISKKTDLLLATRRRIIDMAGNIISGNHLFDSIDWKKVKKGMIQHMHKEAAYAFYARGIYTHALKHSSPFNAGFSRESIALFLRSAIRMIFSTDKTVGQ
jgi:glycosyltransferase involved in cell wall biosynthesis